jgi:hypothetical protein
VHLSDSSFSLFTKSAALPSLRNQTEVFPIHLITFLCSINQLTFPPKGPNLQVLFAPNQQHSVPLEPNQQTFPLKAPNLQVRFAPNQQHSVP